MIIKLKTFQIASIEKQFWNSITESQKTQASQQYENSINITECLKEKQVNISAGGQISSLMMR